MAASCSQRWIAGALLLGGAVGVMQVSACRGEKKEPSAHAPMVGLKRGDRVVIEAAAAQFFEGQVLEASGRELRVQTAEKEETVRVQVADAYRLPPAASRVSVGDFIICSPAAERWAACQVVTVQASTVVAATAQQQEHRLTPDRILVPTALTALNLRRHFERSGARHSFARAVEDAGQPRAPQGWRPGPRERVLGLRDAAWQPATVHELEDDGPYLRWSSDGRVSKVLPQHAVPEPPYEPGVERGHYALARPAVGAGAWQPVRVVSVGKDTIVVADVTGRRRTLAARDLVPLR